MNTQLLTVTSTGSTQKTAKVAMTGLWLVPLGFHVGAKVIAIPVNHGIDFFLLHDDMSSPSEGKHLNVICITYKKWELSYPALMTSGSFIDKCGLSKGDICVMKHIYGKISIRKLHLPDFGFYDKLHNYACCFGSSFKQYTPSSTEYRLIGRWLIDYGFSHDVFISAKPEIGMIAFERMDEGIQDYRRLVKSARQHKLQFLQVGKVEKRGGSPYIGIPRQTLSRARFKANDIFVACCEMGCIKIVAIPLEKLGFPQ